MTGSILGQEGSDFVGAQPSPGRELKATIFAAGPPLAHQNFQVLLPSRQSLFGQAGAGPQTQQDFLGADLILAAGFFLLPAGAGAE